MSEQINTPKLRFPEFRDEWEIKIIKELFNVVSGSTPLRSNTSYYENGNIPWVKTTDLNNSLINDTSEKVTDIALNNLKLLPKDTVLIAMYGGFNQIGRTGILNIKATTNQAISALIKKGNYNSKFLQSYLNFNVKQWRRFAASSRKDPNITKRDIEKFKIPYTCLEEQEKIGTFFSKLDRQIELEEEKLELLEQQKRGYMQKLFSQELQFKDKVTNNFNNWSEFKIKDIFSKIESGNRLPKSNLLDGDIPYVIAQTTNNGVYMNISKDTLDYHGNNLKKFKKGSITISIDNPDAMFIQTHDFVTSNVMRVLYNENLSIEAHTFILYSLRKLTQTYNWSVKFSGPIIMDSKIKLPVKLNTNDIDWNIVNKIGEFLTKLDFKIYQNTTKVELLKQRKQGLLQKMFI